MATSVLAVAVLFLLGLALVELLAGVRRFGSGAAAAAALPLGLVAHAAFALPLALLGVAPGLPGAGLAALALFAAGRWRAQRRDSAPPLPPPTPWRVGEIAAAAALAAVALFATAIAWLEPPVEWDLVAIWGLKARLLAGSADWLTRIADPALAYAHPDYPLAWPLALALEPALAASAPRGGAGLLGVALLAAAGGSAAALVRRHGRRAALAAAALVVTLPLATTQAVRALADLPLAALFTVAAGALASGCSAGDRGRLALGVVATAGLPLLKQEGMALAVGLAVVALARCRRGTRALLASRFAISVVALDLPWFAVRSTLPAGAANSFADMTLSRVAAGFARVPALLAALPLYLGAIADWGALWGLVAVALVVLAGARERLRPTVDFALLAAAPLPLYLAALMAVGWEPERLAEVTLARLALHFAPCAAALAVAVAARRGVFGRDATAIPSGEEDGRVGG